MGSAGVCGNQMSASGVIPQAQLTLFPCQDLPEGPRARSPIRRGWLASNPAQPSVSIVFCFDQKHTLESLFSFVCLFNAGGLL